MSALVALFNGPPVAGIGATTDAGLARDKYHKIPYGGKIETNGRHLPDGTFTAPLAHGEHMSSARAVAIARYNLEHVFNIEGWKANNAGVAASELDALERDVVAILVASLLGSYYIQECTHTVGQFWGADATDAEVSEIMTIEMMNRAFTFIMARMHTKYQTNHITGGNPMQASMMATYKAFYNVSGNGQANVEQRNKSKAAIEILHWALHPLNETLLIPVAIMGTGMKRFRYFADAPPPQPVQLDEFFALRRYTPPASTHHYYTCHAAVKLLAPMGVLEFLPDKSRLEHIRSGFLLIKNHGAALHPAAAYWGLDKVSANQKIIEPLAQDLGYAVLNLMPASSLSGSPILKKCDAINTAWKSFIDQIKRVMDDSDESMLSAATIDQVRKSLMLTGTSGDQVHEIAMLTIEPAPVSIVEPKDAPVGLIEELPNDPAGPAEPDIFTPPAIDPALAATTVPNPPPTPHSTEAPNPAPSSGPAVLPTPGPSTTPTDAQRPPDAEGARGPSA